MTRHRRQAECGENLADCEIDDQQPAGRGTANSTDESPRLLLQTVSLQQPDDRQDDPDDRDISVVVESVSEGGEHLQERHMAEEPGDVSCDCNDQQRIEPQSEADDNQCDPEQRPVIDHSPHSPNAPPPGVSITNRSPARTSAEAVALSVSTEPSVRSTQ